MIWGNGEDPSLGNGLNVTLIATGFNEKDDKRYTSSDNDSDVKVHRMYCDVTGSAPDV